MPTLSVVMIVKNEAHCLGDCLKSVRSIADEIVVGDTGSTDDTKSIAKSWDARVIDVPWNNDFAEARNAVLSEATGDWLLHMDADEVLDPEGAFELRAIVDRDGDNSDAVWVTLANYCDDYRSWRWTPSKPGDPFAREFSGYVKTDLVRLFRNGMGIEYRERVHENLGQSLLEVGARFRQSSIFIHHYGFDPNTPRAKEKSQRYLELAREKVHQMPDEAKAWFDLAAAASQLEHREEAEEAARKSLELDPAYTDAAYILAHVLLNRKEYEDARRILESFLETGKAPLHFVTGIGAIAALQGKLDESLEWFRRALEADNSHLMTRLYCARTHDQLGDYEAAKRELETASRAHPNMKEPRTRLEALELRKEGEAIFAEGNHVGALQKFVEALRLDSEDPILHNDTGVALLALERPNEARESFERALLLAPNLQCAKTNLAAFQPV